MKIAIVYCSKTGNTRLVAEAIRDALPAQEIVWCGAPAEGIEADLYFAGSWTDKGQCDAALAAWLGTLQGKTLAYFGTAGFGGSPAYFDTLFARVQAAVPPANRLLGRFFCQGKMPAGVRSRYVALLTEHPEDKNLQVSLQNFDAALTHPDAADLSAAAAWAAQMAALAE